VDGDGVPDFVVAAPYYDDAVGEVRLYSGGTNARSTCSTASRTIPPSALRLGREQPPAT
jgi:hypothetical protein